MFRTPIEQPTPGFQLDLNHQVLSLGSCFAQNIGEKLVDYKFNVTTNPSGVIFNPLSIFEQLQWALGNQAIPENTILNSNGIFFNYKFHSSINHHEKNGLKESIESHLADIGEQIKHSDLLILTFGTAWVYELMEENMLVANCHKMPQGLFRKKLITVDEIVSGFKALHQQLAHLNPNLNILLTVSPVRHTKEGLANNSLSKSILRVACHELSNHFDHIDYFPAYEMLMDDLRDYRFYQSDMIHPNGDATQYVWNQFSSSYFTERAKTFIGQWQKIINAMHHKPFHEESQEHQKFLKNLLQELENLSSQVDVSQEVAIIKKSPQIVLPCLNTSIQTN